MKDEQEQQQFLIDIALQINELNRMKGDKTLRSVPGTEAALPPGIAEVHDLLKDKFGPLYLQGRKINFENVTPAQITEIVGEVLDKLSAVKKSATNDAPKPKSSLLAVPGTKGSNTRELISDKIVKLRDDFQNVKPSQDSEPRKTTKPGG